MLECTEIRVNERGGEMVVRGVIAARSNALIYKFMLCGIYFSEKRCEHHQYTVKCLLERKKKLYSFI